MRKGCARSTIEDPNAARLRWHTSLKALPPHLLSLHLRQGKVPIKTATICSRWLADSPVFDRNRSHRGPAPETTRGNSSLHDEAYPAVPSRLHEITHYREVFQWLEALP
jgi:hypothetical protein